MVCDCVWFTEVSGRYLYMKADITLPEMCEVTVKGKGKIPEAILKTGPCFNIKMSSYQYRKSHCGDKTILRPSYLHKRISYTGKMISLYCIWAQMIINSRWLHAPLCTQSSGFPFTNMVQIYSQHGQIITSIIICGTKLLIQTQTSMVQPLDFGNGHMST